jgi:hypothetical protein
MVRIKDQSRLRTLVVLSVFLGWIFSSPQSTHADACTDCDWAHEGAIAACRTQYESCLLNQSQANCDFAYSMCWADAGSNYVSCLQGCAGSGGSGGGSGGDPTRRNSCVQGCDQVFTTCFADGGAPTYTYQACVASGGSVDDCCYEERLICLGGC